MSQALTFQPRDAASKHNAPDPQPISNNFLPLPGPKDINLVAIKSVSSLGGYTVGGIVSSNLYSFDGFQSTGREGRTNLSTSLDASSGEKNPPSVIGLIRSKVPLPLCLLENRNFTVANLYVAPVLRFDNILLDLGPKHLCL